MPATEAQIRANRDNARKSTGPKTEAGKAKARMNALKHGMRSRNGLVLPHEDPAELDARIQTWVDDWRPANAIERQLVERAAKASWALERAERYEVALLSKRVRKATSGSRTRRAAKVGDLGRELFRNLGRPPGHKPDEAYEDDPAALVAAIEDSPEGVRWAIDRWEELRGLIDGDHEWSHLDRYKFARLLGKQPFDAVFAPRLNAIFLAWDVLKKGAAADFWEWAQKSTQRQSPAFSEWASWRDLAPRPADRDEARARLRAVVDAEVERLDELLAALEDVEADDPFERAEAASFLAGDAGERLRRYQSARTRELFRAVQMLAKLRKDAAKLDRDHDGLPPSRGKVAAERPDEGGSAALQESADGSASDAGRPPQLTPAASVFPREGGRPSTAPPEPKRRDPHPALRAAFSRREKGGDGLAASKNGTNEPAVATAEASSGHEVTSTIAGDWVRERTQSRAAV